MAKPTRILLLAFTLCVMGASPANAYVFWGHDIRGGGVGRAALDGTRVNDAFITPPGFYGRSVGVAVKDGNVYWGAQAINSVSGGSDVGWSVGRATVEGAGVNHASAGGTGQYARGLGASASHVFWTSWNLDTSDVGRTPIQGGQQFQSFSSVFGQPNPRTCGVAADDTYVYWANYNQQTIGRATLANYGTQQQVVEPSWVTLAAGSGPCGIAVDDGHVYWGLWFTKNNGFETPGTKIGRINKDGTGKNESFISGLQGVSGVAVDGQYVYSSNWGDGSDGKGFIARSSTSGGGSGVLVQGLLRPMGVAVESTGPAPGTVGSVTPQRPIQLPAQFCTGCSPSSTPSSTKGDPPADFSRAWTTNKVFAPARTNTPLNVFKSRAAKKGTTFNFIANRAGTVRIVISGVGKGRKSGKKCVKPTKRLARKKACVRLTKVWTLTRAAKAGRNSVPFTGRVRGKALKPGRYQASFTGVSGKRSGKSKVVAFRVVRP